MDTLSLSRVLLDGLILSAALSVIVFGSLYINPRLWLQDYPKEMRAKVLPLNVHERRIRWVLVVLVLAVIFGILYVSTGQLKAANGGRVSFTTAFLNTFLVFNIFNLFDALVIDFLILTLMKPKFAVLPGTEGMEYLYNDWRLHVGNYLKGIVVSGIGGALMAGIAML